jgi:hypothetical protein
MASIFKRVDIRFQCVRTCSVPVYRVFVGQIIGPTYRCMFASPIKYGLISKYVNIKIFTLLLYHDKPNFSNYIFHSNPNVYLSTQSGIHNFYSLV